MEIKISDLERAKRLLEQEGYSCVLCKGKQQYASADHGVKPLLQWYHTGTDLKGFCAADQVVGKAAAFLYIQLGIKEIYCRVISEKGKELLAHYGVPMQYEQLVPEIKNRRGDDMCPMERTVEHLSDPEEAIGALTRKVQEMRRSTN